MRLKLGKMDVWKTRWSSCVERSAKVEAATCISIQTSICISSLGLAGPLATDFFFVFHKRGSFACVFLMRANGKAEAERSLLADAQANLKPMWHRCVSCLVDHSKLIYITGLIRICESVTAHRLHVVRAWMISWVWYWLSLLLALNRSKNFCHFIFQTIWPSRFWQGLDKGEAGREGNQ